MIAAIRDKYLDLQLDYHDWCWERSGRKHEHRTFVELNGPLAAIQQLAAALEAGGYNAAPESLKQSEGFCLHIEDLSPVMQLVTFEDPHIKAWIASLPWWRRGLRTVRTWTTKKLYDAGAYRWWWDLCDQYREM